MMDVLIALDTEDYVTPQAWDAQKWWAHELRDRGITGSFQCVAELIRTLKREGRGDVIDALAAHEIGYHTNLHSVPPTHAHALAGLPLADAIAWVMRAEAAGFAELIATFGRVPVSFCPPGDVWTPATILALARMGIKVWAGSTAFAAPGRIGWCLGMLSYAYHVGFDDHHWREDGAARFLAAFNDFAARAAAASAQPVVCIWTHPTMLVTSRFWDVPFTGGRPVAREDLHPAPLRQPHEVQRAKDNVQRVLDMLQSRKDIRFVDQAALYARSTAHDTHRCDLDALLAQRGLQPGQEHLLLDIDDVADRSDADALGVRFNHRWPPLPRDLDWSNLESQARRLLWTRQPA